MTLLLIFLMIFVIWRRRPNIIMVINSSFPPLLLNIQGLCILYFTLCAVYSILLWQDLISHKNFLWIFLNHYTGFPSSKKIKKSLTVKKLIRIDWLYDFFLRSRQGQLTCKYLVHIFALFKRWIQYFPFFSHWALHLTTTVLDRWYKSILAKVSVISTALLVSSSCVDQVPAFRLLHHLN